jgi:hypothetical protein
MLLRYRAKPWRSKLADTQYCKVGFCHTYIKVALQIITVLGSPSGKQNFLTKGKFTKGRQPAKLFS